MRSELACLWACAWVCEWWVCGCRRVERGCERALIAATASSSERANLSTSALSGNAPDPA